jgi:hypothetical protein
MRRRSSIAAGLAVTVGAIGLAAVSSGLAAGGSRPVPIRVDVGEGGYAMPSRIAGGVVAMRFRNTGRRVHEFALGRIDPGHTAAEALRAFASNREVPWFHDVSGPGVVTPGVELTITRELAPGTYVFIDAVPDTHGVPFAKQRGWKPFRVVGDSGADLPLPDAVIIAEKKRFLLPPLQAGLRTIELRNRAGAGRGFMLATVDPGHTRADAERWFAQIEKTGRQPSSAPPATLLGAIQTIPSGTSVFVTVELQAGRRYQLSDDESGITAAFTPK